MGLSLSHTIKVFVGTLVGALGLVATWWALDLAMWTAAKDFRDDCRQQAQMFNMTSPECEKVLGRGLDRPPTWRSYLKSPVNGLWGRSEFRAFGIPVEPRGQPASMSASRNSRIVHDELDTSFVPGYGPDEDEDSLEPMSVERTIQHLEDDYDHFWDHWNTDERNHSYPVGQNGTVAGAVESMEIHLLPYPWVPRRHEELGWPMPEEQHEEWTSTCISPSTGRDLPQLETVGLTINWPSHGEALLATFVVLALVHDMAFGRSARKTRQKWQ
jgi:hypothetical protein